MNECTCSYGQGLSPEGNVLNAAPHRFECILWLEREKNCGNKGSHLPGCFSWKKLVLQFSCFCWALMQICSDRCFTFKKKNPHNIQSNWTSNGSLIAVTFFLIYSCSCSFVSYNMEACKLMVMTLACHIEGEGLFPVSSFSLCWHTLIRLKWDQKNFLSLTRRINQC